MSSTDVLREALNEAAQSVHPPVPDAARVLRETEHRKRRNRGGATVAVVVTIAGALLAGSTLQGDEDAQPVTETPSPADVVFMDGRNVSMGGHTFAGPPAATAVTPVLDGVVYADAQGTLWYSTGVGAVELDENVRMGAVAADDPGVIAWIRGGIWDLGGASSERARLGGGTLVVYDLESAEVLSQALISPWDSALRVPTTLNGLESPILSIEDGVVWIELNGKLYTLDWNSVQALATEGRPWGWMVDRAGGTSVTRTGQARTFEVHTSDGSYPLPSGWESSALSADGRFLADIEGGRGRILDIATGDIRTLNVGEPVVALAWSAPSAVTVVSDAGRDSGRVWVCAASSGRCAEVASAVDLDRLSVPAAIAGH